MNPPLEFPCSEPPPSAAPADKPRVLVIDDHADARFFVQAALDDLAEVVEAEDGSSGIDRARDTQPVVILCDILMPGLNGFETVLQLKLDESTRHIPVILISGVIDDVLDFPSLREHFVSAVRKPFSTSELRDTVLAFTAARRGPSQAAVALT